MAGYLQNGTLLRNGRFPYTIECVLGSGGFGVTYKVSTTMNADGNPVKMFFAVKEHFISEWCERERHTGSVTVSSQMKGKVDDSKRDFLAEARRLSQLRHPNIVRVYEQFEENNTAYYVMEYIEGENLRDFVASNGVMPLSFMLKFFNPLSEAIRALHYNKMTHLDIKPANIMIRRQARRISPVLIDFGLSKHYDDNGNATSAIRVQGCSEGYAPMEQYAGITKFSPQSDIYALAASMVYCLSGKRPPRADLVNNEAIASMIPTMPLGIKNALIHAMQQSRGTRTASIEQFVGELNSSNVTPPSPPKPPVSASPRRVAPSPRQQRPPQPPTPIDEYNKNIRNKNNGCWIAFWFVLFVCFCIAIGYWIGETFYSTDTYQPTIDNTPGYSTNVPGYGGLSISNGEKMNIVDRQPKWDNNDYIWLSQRKYSESEFWNMNPSRETLRIWRNSIYARHGYIFKSEDLTAYFSQYSWYNPLYRNVEGQLSDIEIHNVRVLKRMYDNW